MQCTQLQRQLEKDKCEAILYSAYIHKYYLYGRDTLPVLCIASPCLKPGGTKRTSPGSSPGIPSLAREHARRQERIQRGEDVPQIHGAAADDWRLDQKTRRGLAVRTSPRQTPDVPLRRSFLYLILESNRSYPLDQAHLKDKDQLNYVHNNYSWSLPDA
jgi:hypothetical protein